MQMESKCNANAMQKESKGKESKVKEIKEKEIKNTIYYSAKHELGA